MFLLIIGTVDKWLVQIELSFKLRVNGAEGINVTSVLFALEFEFILLNPITAITFINVDRTSRGVLASWIGDSGLMSFRTSFGSASVSRFSGAPFELLVSVLDLSLDSGFARLQCGSWAGLMGSVRTALATQATSFCWAWFIRPNWLPADAGLAVSSSYCFWLRAFVCSQQPASW